LAATEIGTAHTEEAMARQDDPDLQRIVESAIAEAGVESAVIFARRPGSSELELAAAGGIDGPPLERLAEAVRNPAHPISRTVVDQTASFDVQPTAPGGPALRSHLPLGRDDNRGTATGVLAVAHDRTLDMNARRVLEGLAVAAGELLARTD
jgi:hypothetical protein